MSAKPSIRTVLSPGQTPGLWVWGQARLLDWLTFPRRYSGGLDAVATRPGLLGDSSRSLWGDALPATVEQLQLLAQTPPSHHRPTSTSATPSAATGRTHGSGKTKQRRSGHNQPSAAVARHRQTAGDASQHETKHQTRNDARSPSAQKNTLSGTTAATSRATRRNPPGVSRHPTPRALQATVAPSLLRRLAAPFNVDVTPAKRDSLRERPSLLRNQRRVKQPPSVIHNDKALDLTTQIPAAEGRDTSTTQWLTSAARRAWSNIQSKNGLPSQTLTTSVAALAHQGRIDLNGPQITRDVLAVHTARNHSTKRQGSHSNAQHNQHESPRGDAPLPPKHTPRSQRIPQASAAQVRNAQPISDPGGRAANKPVTLDYATSDAISGIPPRPMTTDRREPIVDRLMEHASATLADNTMANAPTGETSQSLASAIDDGPRPPATVFTASEQTPTRPGLPDPAPTHPPSTQLEKPLPTPGPALDDLADQIKRILDDEARRHGIDV